MTDFGIRLRDAMDREHISAAELSRRSSVSKGLISYYLKGRCLAKQDKVYLLAKALNVNPGWLMTGVEQVEEDSERPVISVPSEKFVKIVDHMSIADYRIVMEIFEKTYKKMQEEGIV